MTSNNKILLATLAIILVVATTIVIYLSGGFTTSSSSSPSQSDVGSANEKLNNDLNTESKPLILGSTLDEEGKQLLTTESISSKKTQLLPIIKFTTTTVPPSPTLSILNNSSSSNSSETSLQEQIYRNKGLNDATIPDDVAWVKWLDKFRPHYYYNVNQDSETRLEAEKRKKIFVDNRNFILAHNNKQNSSFKLKLNLFADLTSDEINHQYIGDIQDKQAIYNSHYKSPPPVNKGVALVDTNETYTDGESIDWFKKNAVYPARDQGKCHSGLIYSIVAHMDSAYYIKGQPMRFSTQELLDCFKNKEMTDTKRSICESNTRMVDLLFYLQQKGIHLASDYPSVLNGPPDDYVCKLDKITNQQVAKSLIKIQSYSMVHPADINEALQNIGPLPVTLNASLRTFHFYSEGVYDDKDCSKAQYNHHALLIGYDARRQAWILQNSFGQQWGQMGQILIKRTGDNLCGLEEGAIHVNL